MNKKALCLAVAMLSLCVLAGCNKDSPSDTVDTEDYVVKIEYNNDTYKVRYNSDNKNFDYYINNEISKTITGDYATANAIELPDTDKVNDLSTQGVITDGVYEANLNIASEYVNYLLDNNYQIKYKAETSKFIELYMSNESTIKRLIITDDYLVNSDVYEIPEIIIEDYLFK